MGEKGYCKNKIASFASKLDSIDVKGMNSSPYTKRYLDHLLTHRLYYLAIYAEVLDTALAKTSKEIHQLNLLDYGSGNGLLGMFAGHCGFGKIFLCDMNEKFVEASKLTAQKIDVSIVGFITGELEQVNQYFPGAGIDIIAGTDVIEHIYDPDLFFAEIKKMNRAMITVFTTASNPDNYFKVRQLKKMQIKDELQGGDPGDFILAGEEKHAAYFEMRKKIIQDNFSMLKPGELDELATATRGLRRADILQSIHTYLAGEQSMPLPAAGTNTCHPETGSWSERILSIEYYQQLYERNGFCLDVKNGFYNSFDKGRKKTINIFMNLLVKIMGKKTAPFITLTGFPQE